MRTVEMCFDKVLKGPPILLQLTVIKVLSEKKYAINEEKYSWRVNNQYVNRHVDNLMCHVISLG